MIHILIGILKNLFAAQVVTFHKPCQGCCKYSCTFITNTDTFQDSLGGQSTSYTATKCLKQHTVNTQVQVNVFFQEMMTEIRWSTYTQISYYMFILQCSS
jgi:hypothetical protein